MTPLRTLRVLLLNTTLLAASLFMAVLVAEVFIRLVTPQQLIRLRPDIWHAVDSVGWAHRPNVATTINTGERTVRLFTDRDGFRVSDQGRVEAPREVLLLGDSYLVALQVEYEQSFAGLLQAHLKEQFNDRVAVRNAGVNGWGPNQYYLAARNRLARDTVDLIVVALYVGNDVINEREDRIPVPPRAPAVRRRLRFPRGVTRREIVNALLMPVNDFLERRSHLFVFVKNRLEILRMRLGITNTQIPRGFLRDEANSTMWSVTADRCRTLADTAAEHGVPILFVLIPAPHQVDQAVFESYLRGFRVDSSTVDLEQPNRLLAHYFAERNLRIVDLLDGFRAAHQRRNDLFGEIDSHLTPRGNRVMFELLIDEIVTHLHPSPSDSSEDSPSSQE